MGEGDDGQAVMIKRSKLYAATLLLLPVVIATMWMRSYAVPDTFFRTGSWLISDTSLPRWFESSEGSLSWRCYPRDDDASMAPLDYRRLGFVCYYGRDDQPAGTGTYFRWIVLAIPYWFVWTIAALPAIRFLLRRRIEHIRRRDGFCTACGYDLRATADRCPECGHTTPPPRPGAEL